MAVLVSALAAQTWQPELWRPHEEGENQLHVTTTAHAHMRVHTRNQPINK